MRRLLTSLIMVVSLGAAQAGEMTVRLDDILLLSQRGVSDETILVFLQNRKIDFTPDADDIDKLLQAGLSEKIIRYLLKRTASTPSYINQKSTYANPYPTRYYAPRYTGTSLFFGFSSFLHPSFEHRRYGTVHNYRPQHITSLQSARHTPDVSHAIHDNKHRVTHTSGPGSRHGAASTVHSKSASIRHNTAGISHNGRSSGGGRCGGHGGGH